ncbi:hypothetical protein DERF_002971 [Dermatophagoides farinae]|uniref:Uncharacterized protein n=1 Tax=Dermatophagoides farinae TaxID=6954 RepID=A0A922LCA8_DERFA|nr:hypothetical protein DERF_002971 [Dermatophagoides farinae]
MTHQPICSGAFVVNFLLMIFDLLYKLTYRHLDVGVVCEKRFDDEDNVGRNFNFVSIVQVYALKTLRAMT